LRRRYTDNAAAYEAYVRGRAALVEYTPAGTVRAVAAFQQALERDNRYALARAGLAMACADMYLRFSSPRDVDRWGMCAEGEARAALDVDPDLAEAHLARAMLARKREFDWSGAIAASQRALVLNANLDQAHFISAAAYYHLGYMEEALIELERGRRLRGQDVIEPIRIEALVALFSGNFAAARTHLEDVSRRSSLAIGDTYLGLAYYYTGNIERARPMLEALAKSGSASTATRAGAALAGVLAALRESDAALVRINSVLGRDYRDHHVAYGLGAAYAQLANFDEAVRWLGTAADTGFPCAIWFERDPLLAPVRQHPAFAVVMERVRAQRQSALARLDALGR
jgi:tetratricopeptide (TPR) repeat protein